MREYSHAKTSPCSTESVGVGDRCQAFHNFSVYITGLDIPRAWCVLHRISRQSEQDSSAGLERSRINSVEIPDAFKGCDVSFYAGFNV